MTQHDASAAGGDELVGALVAGRYRITRKVGEGGMGTVYLAVHEALRKPVALKLLSGRGSVDRETVARFEREAVAAASLRHPRSGISGGISGEELGDPSSGSSGRSSGIPGIPEGRSQREP